MDQKSVDTRTPLTNLTERYSQAVSYAAVLHGAQMRKGTSIAYISHLLGVSSLVIEAGGDEDLVKELREQLVKAKVEGILAQAEKEQDA